MQAGLYFDIMIASCSQEISQVCSEGRLGAGICCLDTCFSGQYAASPAEHGLIECQTVCTSGINMWGVFCVQAHTFCSSVVLLATAQF